MTSSRTSFPRTPSTTPSSPLTAAAKSSSRSARRRSPVLAIDRVTPRPVSRSKTGMTSCRIAARKVAAILVHRITPGLEVKSTAEGFYVPALDVEQRLHERAVPVARIDPRDPFKTGAADQVEQDRLGLIVECVSLRGGHGADLATDVVRGDHPSHGGPCLDGDSLARSIVGGPEMEGDLQAFGELPDVSTVLGRIGAELVIEVEDGEADLEQAPEVPQGSRASRRSRDPRCTTRGRGRRPRTSRARAPSW